MTREQVQFFLDNLPQGESFGVIFRKVDDSQRCLVGNLTPNDKSRKDNVPMETDDGIKSFNLDRVLWIGFPDQVETIKELMHKESV